MSFAPPASRPPSWVPGAAWLWDYRPALLRRDAVAGATLAAYAIPVSLAYASLAGVPPHYGIYCYLVAGPAYATLGSSRQMAIGPTAAIAMMVGTSVAALAPNHPERWASIAALVALLVAMISGLAAVLRLSGLVSFISETILTGFKAGAALAIGMTQLPKLFGVEGGGESFFERGWILLTQLPETHPLTLLLGLTAISLLVLGDRLLAGRPIALGVVILAIGGSTLWGLNERGVEVVGAIPIGLPELAWPSLRPRDVDGVLPLAAACFLLSYVEGVSAARTLAAQHRYAIDPHRELVALGGANLAVALFHGIPVAGGLSQSAVNNKAGAASPLALVLASSVIAICLLFLTGPLAHLPNVVLAAVVLVAVRGLFDLSALKRLWRISRFEFTVALVALCGVLLLGILQGVLLAVIVSLLILVATAAHPHVAILGRIPGTQRCADRRQHPEAELIPGVLAFRIEASLLYFNVDHAQQVVAAAIRQSGPLEFVVCDLSNAPYVDIAGAQMLDALNQDLQARGTSLQIAGANARVGDLLMRAGLAKPLGEACGGESVDRLLSEGRPVRSETTSS